MCLYILLSLIKDHSIFLYNLHKYYVHCLNNSIAIYDDSTTHDICNPSICYMSYIYFDKTRPKKTYHFDKLSQYKTYTTQTYDVIHRGLCVWRVSTSSVLCWKAKCKEPFPDVQMSRCTHTCTCTLDSDDPSNQGWCWSDVERLWIHVIRNSSRSVS